jgi:hypothetical protein
MIKNKIKIDKKGQEEMVGFALIVIIVTIAIVIFLVFSLSKPSGFDKSLEVENFLQASGYITGNCNIGGQNLNVKKLVVACKNNERCSDGRDACDALDGIFSELLESNWDLEYFNGHHLLIYSIGEGENIDEEEITPVLELKNGNLTGNYQGGDILFPVPPERFHINLKIYF